MPRVCLDWIYSARDLDNLERSIVNALGDALGAKRNRPHPLAGAAQKRGSRLSTRRATTWARRA